MYRLRNIGLQGLLVFVVAVEVAGAKSPASTPEPIVPPIAAAVKPSPLPDEEALSLMLGNQVRDLIRERQRYLETLGSSSKRESRTIVAEIQKLEDRLTSGPDVQKLVNAIAKQVSQIRGLPLKQPITANILDRKKMQAFVEEKLEEDMPPQHLRRLELMLKSVGGLSKTANLRRILIRLISEQAAGLYDPITKKLFVSSNFSLDRPTSRIILAHEICHALQDQHFDIRTMMKRESANDDRAMAVLSLIEGDATVLMALYAIEHLRVASILDFSEILTQDQRAYRSTPYFLRQSLVFPYLAGQEFLNAVAPLDFEATDKLFKKPPVSTEQIMVPGKYKGWDEPTAISPLALEIDGLTTVAANSLGQFGIRTLFELWRDKHAARRAFGWDGDWVQTWTTTTASGEPVPLDDRTVEDAGLSMTWLTVWDSEEDARDFAEGVATVFSSGPFAASLAQPSSGANSIPALTQDDRGVSRWQVAGREASLRVLQFGPLATAILAHGPARQALEAIPDSKVIDHLRAIKIRD